MVPEEVQKLLFVQLLHCLTLAACYIVDIDSGSIRTDTSVCQRIPYTSAVAKTAGDNGFRIKITGLAQNGYAPQHVYTVSVHGTYPSQRLTGFMLVAVPANAVDEITVLGNFQLVDRGETRFANDLCPDVVTHTDSHPKSGVEFIWTAPPSGSGCVEFRATVIERPDTWFKDEGALKYTICEKNTFTSKLKSSLHDNVTPSQSSTQWTKFDFTPSLPDCDVTSWSSWSECSTTCASGGVQVRHRTLNTPPSSETFLDCNRLVFVTRRNCAQRHEIDC